MNSFRDRLGAYGAELQVGVVRGGWLSLAIAGGWVIFPFALQTVVHPSDVMRLQSALQGLPRPSSFTSQQLAVGFIEAVVALAVFVLIQLVATVMFYRRAQVMGAAIATPVLWPLAAILPGILGNAAWYVATGYFDLGGCLIGFGSLVLTVLCETVCEGLGRDFVLGQAQGWHP